MKRLTLLLFTVPAILLGQESFKIRSDEVQFTSFAQTDIAKVNAIEDVQFKEIVIDKKMTQNDFELMCNGLNWIKKLKIKSGNKSITDISAVSNLKNLQEFELENLTGSKENTLDVKVLAELKNLKKLVLRSTSVHNTEALAQNTLLEELVLFKCDAPSLSFLKSTPSLKKLDLFNNRMITDYSPISALSQLEELDLTFNLNLTDEQLVSITKISTLKSIDIGFCEKPTNLDFLQNKPNLEHLNLNGCRGLTNFTALENISTLKSINANKTQLKDLDVLAKNQSIENLNLRDTEISSVEPLGAFSGLKELDLSDTPLSDIAGLSGCKNLRQVKLINCKINDIGALGQASKLRTLHLINTPVTSIEALKNCSELTFLEVQESPIEDFSPLLEGNNLRRLTVSELVPEEQLNPLKEKFSSLKVVTKK